MSSRSRGRIMSSRRPGGRAPRAGSSTSSRPPGSMPVRSGLTPETELREFLDQWRGKWGVPADQFKPVFGNGHGHVLVGSQLSLLDEVKKALARWEKAAIKPSPKDVKRALTGLWKLAVQVGRQGGQDADGLWMLASDKDADQLRRRWRSLKPILRMHIVEMARQRNIRPLQGVADLEKFIADGAPSKVVEAVVSICSYGARFVEKRPSRSTGKRRRLSDPSPILPVKVAHSKGGPTPRPEVDWLIRDLALICFEATGNIPARGGAFLDLVGNVFDIAGIRGAHDRVREYFDRVDQRPRRLRRGPRAG